MAESAQVGAPRAPSVKETSLRDVWDAISRNRWVVLGVTAGVVALAMGVTFFVRPQYESQAMVRISPGKDAKGGMMSELAGLSDLGLGGLGSDEIDTEIGVMRSRQIVDHVADSLGLHLLLASPRVPRGEALRVIRAPEDTPEGVYTFKRQGDGRYSVSAADTVGAVALPARVVPGQPFRLGSATLALAFSRELHGAPDEVRIKVRPFRRTVRDMLKKLIIERQTSKSKLVEITYRDTDPAVAAAVVNGVAQTFMAYKLRTTKTESRSTVAVLEEQVDSYQRQLAAAEGQLRDYREREQIVAPAEEATQEIKRLAALQAQRDAMQVERESLGRLLAEVRAAPQTPGQESPYRRLATFPSFIANRAVQDMLGALNKLETDRAELLVRRTPSDRDVVGLDSRIHEIEAQLYRMATGYLSSMDNQIAASSAAMGRFGTEMQAIPAKEVEFARLSREAKLLNEIYVLLQTRLKEAQIKDAVDTGDVRLVDAGLVDDEPAWPKPWINLALSTALGLMLGFVTAFAKEVLDTKVRSTADAEAASGGAIVLGSIPRIAMPAAREKGTRALASGAPSPMGERVVTLSAPRSPASEAYRALRTSLTFSAAGTPQVVVLSSALPGDGKSTSAANLAATFAQQGSRVLLVDADLRRGLLHTLVGARSEPGLVHVLLQRLAVDDALQRIEVGGDMPPLSFLAAGACPPNPAELLGSERMRDLVTALRKRFDVIVFDAPPLNMVTDAAVLGGVADCTLVVARSGITEKASLHHAVGQLRAVGAVVGGIVLNDVQRSGHGAYYHENGARAAAT